MSIRHAIAVILILLTGFAAGGLFFRREERAPGVVTVTHLRSAGSPSGPAASPTAISSALVLNPRPAPGKPTSLQAIRRAAREAEKEWLQTSVYSYFPYPLEDEATREEKTKALKAKNPAGTWLVGTQVFTAGSTELTATFFLNFYDGEKAARALPRGAPGGSANDLCWFLAGFFRAGDRDSTFSTSTCRPNTAEKSGLPYIDLDTSPDALFSEVVSFMLIPLESAGGMGPLRFLPVDQTVWQENSGFGWRASSAKEFTAVQAAGQERMDMRNKEAYRQAR